MKLVIALLSIFLTLSSGHGQLYNKSSDAVSNFFSTTFNNTASACKWQHQEYHDNISYSHQPTEKLVFEDWDKEIDEETFKPKKANSSTSIIHYPNYASVFTLHKIESNLPSTFLIHTASKYILLRNFRV